MSTELDLKEYYQIIRKRLGMIIAIVAVSSIACGLVSYFLLNPVYEASTKIIVNRSSEQNLANTIDINEVNTNLRLIDTYKEIIKTPAITEIVVKNYPQFALTASELMEKVSVSSVNNTQVMTIKVEDESYEKAAEVVNAVSNVFKDEISKIFKVDNVTILNKAPLSPVPSPIKPNPKLNIAISFIVSLMVAVGIAFLLEYLDDTIKTEQDVMKYLNLPTLTMISALDAEDMKQARAPSKTNEKAGESNVVTINQ
ncbi:lipopolysaccharide biosynthesis protein [Paenibacillus selenitireducens]|uniref:Lipopolysaccharide biosynthesis protein n=1 Tax=Paenibacillus selenitireducens TaxID=1324314 RepID=A0A1T2XKT4_9BACL|nr:Wzz/FepE/Etk N-terminal domain-containing protein [Paenibacillus selenitireducens]OPA80480.1 lipopolysaccharide biosynthesis protein [Paenibacillus selenitireducens]